MTCHLTQSCPHHVAAHSPRWCFLLIASLIGGLHPRVATAQLAPEIGYVFPSGGQAGTTFDAVLGGYDWSPDMQIFPHDPRIKVELLGAWSPVLVPEPPYWFGAKARGPAWPLPREFAARITIPPDVPPGLIRWQVANANGGSPVGWLHVGTAPEVVEQPEHEGPQQLPSLPVTVSGQIRQIEEIDRYEFRLPAAGPVTIAVVARQLGSPLHGMLRVQDARGRVMVDVADTEGRDTTVTFAAEADTPYVVSLHDLDYAGDRSYVYRMTLTPGPRLVAAFPAAGKRGATQAVEFVGWGIATGASQLETVRQLVTFPPAPESSFSYALPSAHGPSVPITLLVRDEADEVEPVGTESSVLPRVPCAITGALEQRFGSDRYSVDLTTGARLQIAVQSRSLGSPLDLDVAILSPEGQELVTQDDAPGTTDPELEFVAPADGTYGIAVSDRSGQSGNRAAWYRLSVDLQQPDFRPSPSVVLPAQLAVPLSGKATLAVPVVRKGGFSEPLRLELSNLPEGVRVINELVIPADKTDLAVELECAADAPATASLATVTARSRRGDEDIARKLGTVLVAVVMKPRCKITPEGLDDVRKVHRGSTYLAPLLVERLEGYDGPITLEMTSKQQRHRQGLTSDEMVVPLGATRVEYPILVPEWLETTKTSRMILNGVVQVADPRGNVRTLVQRMELRIGILPEGALMKLTHDLAEPVVPLQGEFLVPIRVARASEFREPVRIELSADEATARNFAAEPILLAADQAQAELRVHLTSPQTDRREHLLKLRATALVAGRWPVVSEANVLVSLP